jgi:putative serine/threonine protein kinase
LARNAPDIVPIEDAASEPYATILAYPRSEASAISSRIQQLRELGISELEFTGKLRVGKLSLLGKGVAGMVVAGRAGKAKVALKIRRTDSRRENVRNEASMLEAANAIDVGPRYYGNTADILLMEFVEGQSLPQWITTLRGKGRRLRFRTTVADLFQQCLRMDNAGLDHGELSRAHKNVSVTVSGHAVILDFESASMERRPNNLTSIGQYFFLGSGFAKRVSAIVGPTDKEKLKAALRMYKREKSTDALNAVGKLLMLD